MTLAVLGYVVGRAVLPAVLAFILYPVPELAAFHPAHSRTRALLTLLGAQLFLLAAFP